MASLLESKELILSILNEIKNGTIPIHTAYNLNLDMWAEFIEYLDDINTRREFFSKKMN